jgi:hypothetical protein
MDATQRLAAILRDARKGRAPQDEVGDIFRAAKRAIQYSEVLVMETKSRSVLDTPRSRSMTASARNEATKQSTRRHSGMNLTGSAEPLDRGDFAARGLDARDGFACVLDCRGHVMSVGVHDGAGVARDGDMAFPEHQVAAP